jgi:hypothetical protein
MLTSKNRPLFPCLFFLCSVAERNETQANQAKPFTHQHNGLVDIVVLMKTG